MARKNLLSKLELKDYNNRLEGILEKKEFSVQVKNLLLSMFYKIEVGYKDYACVKQIKQSKESFMENLMHIIKEKCETIELIRPKEEDNAKEKHFYTNCDKKKIECYPNEASLLHALLDMEDNFFFIPNKEEAIKEPLESLLISGHEIDQKEVITNFDGWAWNNSIDKSDINNIEAYTVYELLRILMGNDFLEEWRKDNKNERNYLAEIREFKEFYDGLCRISLIQNSQEKDEKKKVRENLKKLKEELKQMEDKTQFLKETYDIKKKASETIKQLDQIINNKSLLAKEFTVRNEKLSDDEKIFSVSNLVEILQKERVAQMNELKKCNYILEPKNYIERIKSIEEQIEIIEKVKLTRTSQKEEEKAILDLQNKFLESIKQKIVRISNDKEMKNFIYSFRYYIYMPIKYKGSISIIKDIPELQEEVNESFKRLITKACKMKCLPIINKDINYNYDIMKKIIDTKIISLDEIYIEMKKTKQNIELQVFDGETLDRKETLIRDKEKDKDFCIKFEKRLKLFV